MRTRLGWTIHGNSSGLVNNDPNTIHHNVHVCRCRLSENLHSLVEQFFAIKNFGTQKSENLPKSADDIRARRILHDTTRRIGNRYQTGLLWKSDDISLPNSLPMANF